MGSNLLEEEEKKQGDDVTEEEDDFDDDEEEMEEEDIEDVEDGDESSEYQIGVAKNTKKDTISPEIAPKSTHIQIPTQNKIVLNLNPQLPAP